MNPLLSVWFKPRETAAAESSSASRLPMLLIIWAWGAAYAFEQAMFEGRFSQWSFGIRFSLPLLVGLFGGVFYFWTMPFAIDVTSSWFSGRATSEQIRRALIIGAIPRALSVLVYTALALLLGDAFFDDAELPEDTSLAEVLASLAAIGAIVTLTIWSVIATSKTLAEVQGYTSAWKAWLHYIVAFLCMAIALAIPFTLWLLFVRSL